MGVEYVSTLSEFNSITRNSGNKLVVVDFYADWCGPCRAIAPLFERLAGQYTGRARFIKVDVDSASDISQQCGISAMPTFQFYRRGSKVAELQGADPGGLQRTIEQHAPSSSEVAFGGAGQTLGSAGAGAAAAGPPKINWDAPAAQDEVKKRREAMAAAAAQRYTAPPPPKKEEPEKPASSSTDAAPAAAPAADPASSSTPAAAASSSAAANSSGDAQKSNDPRLNVDQSLLQKMLEMGFPQVRAEKALILTGNKSLEPAMEWCFEHMDDADIDEPLQMVKEDGTAKEVLSPEERKKRANDALLKARKRRQEMDKQAEVERERDRIRSGKEVLEAKRQHEENERKRAVEKKRKEKREAALQKKRVQELVAADRAARREKYGGAKAAAEKPKEVAPVPKKPAAPPTGGKLQLRFSDGSRMEQHFEPEHTLKNVVEAIVNEKGVAEDSVKLTTMYPKRTFGKEEYGATLVELKLLPRGVLNVNI